MRVYTRWCACDMALVVVKLKSPARDTLSSSTPPPTATRTRRSAGGFGFPVPKSNFRLLTIFPKRINHLHRGDTRGKRALLNGS